MNFNKPIMRQYMLLKGKNFVRLINMEINVAAGIYLQYLEFLTIKSGCFEK